jgi:sulfur dioxygenase
LFFFVLLCNVELIGRAGGRTDFQSGSASQLYDSIKRILSFSDETLLFVGHDYRGLMTTTVREERNFNPRIAGEVSKEDFVGYMKNLNLPHPKVSKSKQKKKFSF